MIIGTFCLGDTLVTLTRITSLDVTQEATFNLSVTDLPTEGDLPHVTFSFTGENDAALAFAAFIAADEPNLTARAEQLRNTAMRRLMP